MGLQSLWAINCIFENLAFRFPQVESVELIGPNGAGKTTPVKLMHRSGET